MATSRISSIFTAGVGRRILGLFLLAGILPVIFTALLAYYEINRGLEQRVGKTLREGSRAYGAFVGSQLVQASEKANMLADLIDSQGTQSIEERKYLLNTFQSVWLISDVHTSAPIIGNRPSRISAADINFEHLKIGQSQLVEGVHKGSKEFVLLRGVRIGEPRQVVFAFLLDESAIWGSAETIPYMTDICVYSARGTNHFCTREMDRNIHNNLLAARETRDSTPAEQTVDGHEHLAAMSQLFLKPQFAYTGLDVVSSQPTSYALNSTAQFQRVFPPAMLLVVILVAALSINFIGQSLVPLQRLTILARQFASGELASRIRIRTGDEFEALADAFNNMASRLELQISTLKAMAKVDKAILSGAEFENVAEDVITHIVDLTGFEAAAIIARDADSENSAKMISCFETDYFHERVALPQEMGHQWCQPRQVALTEISSTSAPYRERFLSFGLKYAVLIPVVLHDDLKGILILGSDAKFNMRGGRLRRSIDLAGRLAVALASVERDELLYQQAHYDALTGLPNRQLLKDRLEQQLVGVRREGGSGALLFLDLDRFKEINDVYGHSVGDVVLTQAAERIVSEVRDTDTVARLGGDEFVVVIPHLVGDNTTRMTATRILTRLAEPFCVHGINHFLSASVGIVVFPEDGDSVETLLKNADAAMYRAKDAGRSRFEFFSKKLNVESRRKIDLERDLRMAFDKGELEVFYQPQFDLSDGKLCGAEALMRWTHPDNGRVAPREFIQLAEDSALIVDMGRWILDQTCKDLSAIIRHSLHPGSMSINVSTRQLAEGGFTGDILEALERHKLHPGYLQLEVTESTVAQNKDTAISTLNVLRDAGVQVAIDDFGTGYSSLSYLQQLPFDLIKIDKSFVDMIGAGGNSENICRMIIKMAHELGKKAIAEGVESKEQADFLLANKCDFVQGYFYSHPLPQNEFLEFVEKQDFHTQRRKALEIV